jgi:hypothetical protein
LTIDRAIREDPNSHLGKYLGPEELLQHPQVHDWDR